MDRHELALQKLAKGTVIPATPLALTQERKFDEKRERMLMRYYMDAGVGGIASCVHTTQFQVRDPKIGLFRPILEVVSDEVEKFEKRTGKALVKVAGVCGKIDQAVKEAELAKELGYDAVLLSPGGLADYDEDMMIKRTKEVAKIMPVIGFYLQSSVGGKHFSYNYWQRLCEIDNVVAVKSAPFNRYQTLDVVRAAATSSRRDKIALYTGNDDNIVIDLLTKYKFEENGVTYEKQFVGGLLGHWSVWAKKVVEMFEMLKKEAAKDSIGADMLVLANQVTDANAAFFDTANNFAGCIAGLHYVLKKQGIFENIFCLDENETLSPGQAEEIERVYRMYPHLNDDEFIKENLCKWAD